MDLLPTLPFDLSRFVLPIETLSPNPLNLIPTGFHYHYEYHYENRPNPISHLRVLQ